MTHPSPPLDAATLRAVQDMWKACTPAAFEAWLWDVVEADAVAQLKQQFPNLEIHAE